MRSKQKLSDVIQVNPRRQLKIGDIAPFVAMQDIAPHEKKISRYTARKVSGSNKTFQNGDTLLAKITPSLENGKTTFVDILKENEIGHGSTEFIVLCGKENQTLDQFVYYLMRTAEFREEAIRSMTGTSGRQRVQETIFDDYEIVLPSLSIQEKISKTLSDLDSKIQNLQNQNNTLEQMTQEIFKSWFVDFDGVTEFEDSELGKIPKGWSVDTIDKISKVVVGYVGSVSKHYCEQIDGIPMIRTTDLKANGIFYEDLKYVTKEFHHNQKKSQLKNGYILIARFGKSGLPCIFDQEFDANCLNTVIIKPSKKEYFSYYIFHTLKTPKFQSQFQISADGTVQDCLNTKTIAGTLIFIPSEDILQKFNLFIKSHHSKMKQNKYHIKNLTKTRDILLPKLMSGEIQV